MNSNFEKLLNDLRDMQTSSAYSLRESTLKQAEVAIIDLNKQLVAITQENKMLRNNLNEVIRYRNSNKIPVWANCWLHSDTYKIPAYFNGTDYLDQGNNIIPTSKYEVEFIEDGYGWLFFIMVFCFIAGILGAIFL